MALWGNKDEHSGAPKFSANEKNSETGQDQFGNTVYGVDATEISIGGGTVAHTGWVKRTEGSGNKSGRIQEEVLVALSGRTAFASGDATDFANTDAVANSSGTADDSVYPDS